MGRKADERFRDSGSRERGSHNREMRYRRRSRSRSPKEEHGGPLMVEEKRGRGPWREQRRNQARDNPSSALNAGSIPPAETVLPAINDMPENRPQQMPRNLPVPVLTSARGIATGEPTSLSSMGILLPRSLLMDDGTVQTFFALPPSPKEEISLIATNNVLAENVGVLDYPGSIQQRAETAGYPPPPPPPPPPLLKNSGLSHGEIGLWHGPTDRGAELNSGSYMDLDLCRNAARPDHNRDFDLQGNNISRESLYSTMLSAPGPEKFSDMDTIYFSEREIFSNSQEIPVRRRRSMSPSAIDPGHGNGVFFESSANCSLITGDGASSSPRTAFREPHPGLFYRNSRPSPERNQRQGLYMEDYIMHTRDKGRSGSPDAHHEHSRRRVFGFKSPRRGQDVALLSSHGNQLRDLSPRNGSRQRAQDFNLRRSARERSPMFNADDYSPRALAPMIARGLSPPMMHRHEFIPKMGRPRSPPPRIARELSPMMHRRRFSPKMGRPRSPSMIARKRSPIMRKRPFSPKMGCPRSPPIIACELSPIMRRHQFSPKMGPPRSPLMIARELSPPTTTRRRKFSPKMGPSRSPRMIVRELSPIMRRRQFSPKMGPPCSPPMIMHELSPPPVMRRRQFSPNMAPPRSPPPMIARELSPIMCRRKFSPEMGPRRSSPGSPRRHGRYLSPRKHSRDWSPRQGERRLRSRDRSPIIVDSGLSLTTRLPSRHTFIQRAAYIGGGIGPEICRRDQSPRSHPLGVSNYRMHSSQQLHEDHDVRLATRGANVKGNSFESIADDYSDRRVRRVSHLGEFSAGGRSHDDLNVEGKDRHRQLNRSQSRHDKDDALSPRRHAKSSSEIGHRDHCSEKRESYDCSVAEIYKGSDKGDSEGKVLVSPELQEDSEEFKQQVHKAFLKFAKAINENPGQKKRYEDNGQSGTLFCLVCSRSTGRSFSDTHNLVVHTYKSLKIALRVEHLGLHKAICTLLGWSSDKEPNSDKEYQKVLPEEAQLRRDDLILWPPTVVVHNACIGKSSNRCKEGIANPEMEEILRELGHTKGKAKAVYGRHGHTGVIVVKYEPTLSGLEEAERLHHHFQLCGRGRMDWHCAKPAIKEASAGVAEDGNEGENENEVEDEDEDEEDVEKEKDKEKEEVKENEKEVDVEEPDLVRLSDVDCEKKRVLYGYLAHAEDLQYLDYDTRRRCIVRSRKEIDALVDSSMAVQSA